ncbi:DGQHR domain protein [Candidatus Micrarchaeum sp.]|jgi:DNA sulfur modification protein DndB|uniref:DGQHR domain-containing protein n=1 Tax=Candidatus Micrarchaeum sp. TaxID=2282148 RepID=UPI0019349A44|nr:DGQHR domain-containing protein [Candidatus Micrarchaeum sp.]QRF74292.1 DGQHR domain protein [Candidatus Micrarchaeum sp.]
MARRAVNDMAKEFVDEVKGFMGDMGFENPQGGTTFKIGGKQVAAAGGFGNIYIIIDCVLSQEIGDRGNIKSKIEEWRGNYEIFKNGLEEEDILKKYNDVRLVIATKRIRLNEQDRNLAAGNNPKVYIWNEQFFEYYKDLKKKIGKYAKYELLREINFPEELTLRDVPAIKPNGFFGTDLGINYYIASVNPLDLLKISYVARRERGDQAFYQRMISENKINQIEYYINHNRKQFYNNVIVAINDRDRIKFTPSKALEDRQEIGELTIEKTTEPLWIIDGQHRLYGYAKAEEKLNSNRSDREKNNKEKTNWKIPVSFVVGLDTKLQGELFMDINTTQTSLSADYIWDLYSIYNESKLEGFISKLIKKMNVGDGYFKGKIYIPSSSIKKDKGQLTISKIGRAIKENKQIFNEMISSKRDEEEVNKAFRIINTYFEYINEKNIEYANFFSSSVGIQTILPLLKTFTNAYDGDEDKVKEYIEILVKDLDNSEFYKGKNLKKELSKTLGNKTTKEEFINNLINEVNEIIIDEGRQDGLKLLPSNESKSIFAILEKKLRNLINDKLSAINKNWLQTRGVDRTKYENLLKKAKEKTPGGIWAKAGFGECITVMNRNDNWPIFEKLFVSLKGYKNKKELIDDLGRIYEYGRIPAYHGDEREDKVSKYNRQAAEKLAKKLLTVLESLS